MALKDEYKAAPDKVYLCSEAKNTEKFLIHQNHIFVMFPFVVHAACICRHRSYLTKF